MTLHLGLLSVSKKIREVTLPVFYGSNCFNLFTMEGFIPFFSDRGEFARHNIKMLQLESVCIEDQADDLAWEKNITYIRTNLPSLKSLSIYARVLCAAAPATKIWEAIRGDPLSAMSSFKWLSSLESLRGLSYF